LKNDLRRRRETNGGDFVPFAHGAAEPIRTFCFGGDTPTRL
jgi:hypothetical protein